MSRAGAGRPRRHAAAALLATGMCAVITSAVMAWTARSGVPPMGPAPAEPTAAHAHRTAVSPHGWGWPATPPRTLRMPGRGVVAAVDPVGVRADGALAVPDDPRRVGWWVGGAAPGASSGTVLIAGHVDHVRRGRGALFELGNLPIGAVVEVHTAGQRHSYRVTARRGYRRDRLPTALFTHDGPPRLALVTCGGGFDRARGYSHNVVVYAEPAPAGQPRR